MLIATAGTEGEKNILKKAPGHLSITGVESLFFYKSGEGWLTTSTFQLALIKKLLNGKLQKSCKKNHQILRLE